MLKQIFQLSIFLIPLVLANPVFACSVCYGDPNSPESKALTYAIVTLLAILAIIFTIFIRFLININKRAQLLDEK